MITPLITAIVPTYKRPKLLKRAVRSFLGQTFSDFEVLIANTRSGKETEEAIDDLMGQDARVKCLHHATNIGLTATLQSALACVKTLYVCFLCDDDFVAPYFFEEALIPFASHPDIAFSGGGSLLIDQSYTVRRISFNQQTVPPSGYYPPPKGYFTYLHSTFGIAFAALVFKTDVLKKVNGFDLRIRNGSDEDPISKCASRYPVYFLTDRPYCFIFKHDNNLSGKIDYPLFEHEWHCLYENIIQAPFSTKEREEVDLFFNKRHKKILSKAYDYFCSQKNFSNACEYAKKLSALDSSFKWKRKWLEAKIYRYLPFLELFYKSLKKIEKSLRHQKHVLKKEIQNHIPSDAQFWKEYALKLEGEKI